MKLLIVEDHPSVYQVLKIMLEEMTNEIEISHCSDYIEAIQSITENPPDFVITDIQIGEHKQLNVLMECFEKKTPSMVFSSFINSTILSHCEQYKARVVVAKSSPIEELKTGLQSLINNQRYRCSVCNQLYDAKNRLSQNTPGVIFSPAEEFVILAQIEGKSTVQLSEETKKSKYTIRNQRMSLMEKNGCTMEEIARRYLFWHTSG